MRAARQILSLCPKALAALPAAERAGRGALLEAALSRYPAVHAAQLKLFERGDANARIVHSSVFHLNVEPLIARTYGAIPPSLPFSHYRFAERARRFGRHDRLAKHLHKVIDTTGGVPRLADAAVSNLECGAACPSS